MVHPTEDNAMPTIVSQFGLSGSAYNAYVGSARQIVIDSATCMAASIHDGTTPGGHALLFAESNFAEITDVASARSNLGISSAALHPASYFCVAGNNLSELTNAATARANLGLDAAATYPTSHFLVAANNLSDLASVETAQTNLGLGTAAITNVGTGLAVDNSTDKNLTVSYGTTANTACQGNDSRLSSGLQISSNLSDLADKGTARANLGVAIGTNVQAYSAALTLLASGNGSSLTTLSITGTMLPLPTATVKGACFALGAKSNVFITGLGSDGIFTTGTPTFNLGSTVIHAGDTVSSVAGLTLSTATVAGTLSGTFNGTSSGTFTGALDSGATAVTQASGDNSTKVATTAYADATASSTKNYVWTATGSLTTHTEASATWLTKTFTVPVAGAIEITFTGSAEISGDERVMWIQLYLDGTAVPGACRCTSSVGGSHSVVQAITLAEVITSVTATQHTITVGVGMATDAGSYNIVGGSALIIKQVNLKS